MRRTLGLLTLVFALVVSACGDDEGGFSRAGEASAAENDSAATSTSLSQLEVTSTTLATFEVTSTTTAPPPPADIEGFRNQTVACGGTLPPPPRELQFAAANDMGIDSTSRPVATITTSCGDIAIELNPSIAPATVNSFVFLAEAGYFDGTASHRVLPEFVIQAGDPTATGIGNPGYVLPDELPPDGFVYERGLIAMANAGPGTSGSQFFLMLADSGLPPQFSVFGRIVSGLDVIDTIAGLRLGPSTRGELSVPLESVFIESVSVER